MVRSRFPRGVYGRGSEPDPRFSLANERTFLAWIRTALALIASGVALEALGADMMPEARRAAAMALVMLGLAATVSAWFGWRRAETSLRENRALGGMARGLVLTAGVVIAVVIIGVGLLV